MYIEEAKTEKGNKQIVIHLNLKENEVLRSGMISILSQKINEYNHKIRIVKRIKTTPDNNEKLLLFYKLKLTMLKLMLQNFRKAFHNNN